ncbi:MAG: hypothetical protein F6K14_00220 [Symploca sp. SIO2C1]|nr:hypothetical protein [Symploca sp. SIO2C1]
MLQSSSDNFPEQQYALAHFHKLLQKHPFAFWGGLWGILLAVGTVATIGLLNPGSIEEEEPLSTPAPTQIQESPKERDWSLPLFSAVVLGCAGGSLLVTNALRRSTQRRRFSKRPKSGKIVHQQRSFPPKRRRPTAAKTPQPVTSAQTQPKPKQNIPPNIPHNTQPNIPPNIQQTQVTVLSPEDNHPLDSKPESLAEIMDLRKRKSLKSLMRGKSEF